TGRADCAPRSMSIASTRLPPTAQHCGSASRRPTSSPATRSARRSATARSAVIRPEQRMGDLIQTFATRGDLAHLALLLWAAGASAAALFTLRELAFAM